MKTNTIIIKNTDRNCTPVIIEALSKLKVGEHNVISFEKGIYRFDKQNCFTGFFYPSNNLSGKKSVIFPILGKYNLTIDGNGSEFLFCDRVFPFIIQNSEHIELKNFDIDFSFPRHAQGIIKASDEKGFEITIDKELYGYYTQNGNLIFKVGSETISTADKKYFLRDMDDPKVALAYLFAGDSTDSKENLAARFLETDAYETDSGLYFKYREGSKKVTYPIGDRIFIGNDENRENDVIFGEFSKDIKLKNINIYRGAGMGVIAQLCTDIDIDRVNIMPKRNEDVSVTADALHFINCDGKVCIHNCRIEKSIDDAVNIHGAYVVVDKIVSDSSVTIKYGHHEQSGLIPYLKGDIAYFKNGKATVADIIYNDTHNKVTLVFKEKIADVLSEGDILENADRMADFTFEGNTVIDGPHMRLSSKNMVVSNNLLALSHNDILVDDLFDYWYESGTVDCIKITGNDFTQSHAKPCIYIKSCRSDREHKKVIIENNIFATEPKNAIRISAVEKLIMQNNEKKPSL